MEKLKNMVDRLNWLTLKMNAAKMAFDDAAEKRKCAEAALATELEYFAVASPIELVKSSWAMHHLINTANWDKPRIDSLFNEAATRLLLEHGHDDECRAEYEEDDGATADKPWRISVGGVGSDHSLDQEFEKFEELERYVIDLDQHVFDGEQVNG